MESLQDAEESLEAEENLEEEMPVGDVEITEQAE